MPVTNKQTQLRNKYKKEIKKFEQIFPEVSKRNN